MIFHVSLHDSGSACKSVGGGGRKWYASVAKLRAVGEDVGVNRTAAVVGGKAWLWVCACVSQRKRGGGAGGEDT